MVRNGKPQSGSGKTRFNRMKSKGASWVAERAVAIKEGTFKISEGRKSRERNNEDEVDNGSPVTDEILT